MGTLQIRSNHSSSLDSDNNERKANKKIPSCYFREDIECECRSVNELLHRRNKTLKLKENTGLKRSKSIRCDLRTRHGNVFLCSSAPHGVTEGKLICSRILVAVNL